MKPILQSAALTVTLALAIPVLAAEQKKEKDPETLEKMVAAGTLAGKIIQFKESSRELKLQVEVGMAVPNSYHVRELAKHQLAVVNDVRIKDPVQRQIRLQQRALDIAYHQARVVEIKRKSQVVDVQGNDDMKVRLVEPPKKYDDKGSVIKLTKKDLDELKGPDKKMPGYMGELSNLEKGQIVQVTLARKKATPGAAKDNPAANALQAITILILKDADK